MAEQMVSVTREIDASPESIFDLLADPSRHGDIDGSGMVLDVRKGPERLALGAKFGMDMKMGPVPYRISSNVVEFEENRLIAWAHYGKHRWRYELEPLDGGARTRVTETFDCQNLLAIHSVHGGVIKDKEVEAIPLSRGLLDIECRCDPKREIAYPGRSASGRVSKPRVSR